MKFAFAGQQSFAEQHFGAFEKTALGEVGLMGDQDIFDPFGIADQIDVLRAQAKMDQVAMIAGQALQELGRIFAELRQDTEYGKSFAQGRAGDHDSRLDLFGFKVRVAGRHEATRPGCARMDRLAIGLQVANLPHSALLLLLLLLMLDVDLLDLGSGLPLGRATHLRFKRRRRIGWRDTHRHFQLARGFALEHARVGGTSA